MWRVDSVRQSGESVAQRFVKIKSKLFLGHHFWALLDGIFILAPQPHGVPAQLHGIPAQLHGGDGGPNSSKKGDERLYIHICMDENLFFLTKIRFFDDFRSDSAEALHADPSRRAFFLPQQVSPKKNETEGVL